MLKENGVFWPDQPVSLANGQRVSLTIDAKSSKSDELADIEDLIDSEFTESCRQNAAEPPSIEEVRQILDAFKGSLSSLISDERDKR